MAYAFDRDDGKLARGTRRIATGLIRPALALIDEGRPLSAEDIHKLRTTVKKLRGLIRLVRPGLATADEEDKVLRDAARGISAPRDSEVMRQTLEALAPGDALPTLRAALDRAHADAHGPGVLDTGLAAYRAALRDLEDRVARWKLSGKGRLVLQAGVAATFDRARRDWHAARASGDAHAMHETRKRIKAHGYQARLLEPVWPAMMTAHRAVVDPLGETLGQMNDLAVFAAHVESLDLPDRERAQALALAHARYGELRDIAIPDADKLLSEDGTALAARWGAWWSLWRKEG
ncbi:CHAD domain-containing protein [Acidimangrovimonas sediminis]|uniref:CHAD domain-containing protein n=1 Tax=Acidimangrovimonas sediminis TaxID=2056283 RepID=UPI000C80B012|nr:CHAD domain-containing protein [Acidimangrovimonas sediminis]